MASTGEQVMQRVCQYDIVTSHRRGAQSVSRLASWYPERVTAYAFIAVPYIAPWPQDFHYETYLSGTKEDHGYEIFGYWAFFNRDDVDRIIQEHVRISPPLFWSKMLINSLCCSAEVIP